MTFYVYRIYGCQAIRNQALKIPLSALCLPEFQRKKVRANLLRAISHENLLSVTRIQDGATNVNKSYESVEEVVAEAVFR